MSQQQDELQRRIEEALHRCRDGQPTTGTVVLRDGRSFRGTLVGRETREEDDDYPTPGTDRPSRDGAGRGTGAQRLVFLEEGAGRFRFVDLADVASF